MSPDLPPREPELVASGAFRIDRDAALAKLAGFRLQDPWLFAVAWLRAASLSRASEIEAIAGDSASELAFDGVPLPEAFFAQPYDAFFSEEASPAGRQIVAGVLAALRLEPSRLEIRSGGRLWAIEDGVDRFEAAPHASGTRLAARWPSARGEAYSAAFRSQVEKSAAMLPQAVFVGRPGAPLSWKRDRHPFSLGLERELIVDWVPEEPRGLVRLYRNHIAAGEPFERPGFEFLHVDLNDDGFRLDLSGCEVVKDAYFEESLARAAAEAERLRPAASRRSRRGWLSRLFPD